MAEQMNNHPSRGGTGYGRFFAMIVTSTVAIFGLMYLNTNALGHVFFSQARMWMALYAGAAIAFAVGVWLARTQASVDDVAWMKAMIPHHSSALLTSKRADISDLRVRALADTSIDAQRAEIAEMKIYTADIETNGDAPAGTKRDEQT